MCVWVCGCVWGKAANSDSEALAGEGDQHAER